MEPSAANDPIARRPVPDAKGGTRRVPLGLRDGPRALSRCPRRQLALGPPAWTTNRTRRRGAPAREATDRPGRGPVPTGTGATRCRHRLRRVRRGDADVCPRAACTVVTAHDRPGDVNRGAEAARDAHRTGRRAMVRRWRFDRRHRDRSSARPRWEPHRGHIPRPRPVRARGRVGDREPSGRRDRSMDDGRDRMTVRTCDQAPARLCRRQEPTATCRHLAARRGRHAPRANRRNWPTLACPPPTGMRRRRAPR